MPISLYATSCVEEMLRAKFGLDNFTYLSQYISAEQDTLLAFNKEQAIVQLDTMPNQFDKGSLPGLHWLEDMLAQKDWWHETSIILTAWDPFIFAKDSSTRLRTRMGAQPKTALLESPLLKFMPIQELLSYRNHQALLAAFPTIDFENASSKARFLHDISENCYKQAGIASFCHRLRQMFGEYWKKEQLSRGTELVERFQADLYTMINRVYKNCRSELLVAEASIKIEEHLGQLKSAVSLEESMVRFSQLERELITLDRREELWKRQPLYAHIILITKDTTFANRLIGQLHRWKVMGTIVANYEEALVLLKSTPEDYCCVFSDFRIHESDGKLSPQQGYESLRKIHDYDKGLKVAFLTGLYGARWEQPAGQNWLFFEKSLLESLNSKSAGGMYVFLKIAQEQHRIRYSKLPDYLLGNRSVFKGIEDNLDYVGNYLRDRLGEIRRIVEYFGRGERNNLNWPLAANSKTGDRDFICECAFRRLAILAMIRHHEYEEMPRMSSHKVRLREVIAFVTNAEDEEDKQIDRSRDNCRDFLRIGLSEQYHDVPLTDLQEAGLLFPYEVVFLEHLTFEN